MAVSGRLTSTEWKPISAAAFFFIRTYVAESGRSPTRTTASPGVTLCSAWRSATWSFNSSRMSLEIWVPLIFVASGRAGAVEVVTIFVPLEWVMVVPSIVLRRRSSLREGRSRSACEAQRAG